MPDPAPQVHLKPIATGDVVIDGEDGWTRRLIDEHYNDAVAVEMEGAGLFLAAHANGDLSAGVIRGISDLTVGKQQADSAGWQDRAARHAAGFGVELLAQLDPRQLPAWRDRAEKADQGRREGPSEDPSGASVNLSGASIRYANRDYQEQTINHNYYGGSSGRP